MKVTYLSLLSLSILQLVILKVLPLVKNYPFEKRVLQEKSPDSLSHQSLNYYYVNAYFGNPPVLQSLIVDTGSSFTGVPCLSICSRESCGKHMNDYFDFTKSTKIVNCNEDACSVQSSNKCNKEQQCIYTLVHI